MKQSEIVIKTIILVILLLTLEILLTITSHFFFPELNLRNGVQVLIDMSLLIICFLGYKVFFKERIKPEINQLKLQSIISYLCIAFIWIYISPLFKYPFFSYPLNFSNINICVEKFHSFKNDVSFNLYSIIRMLLITPILEELLFRRLILLHLKLKYGLYFSIIITSILFSISHLDSSNSLIFFIGSILLCSIFLRTNNVKYSIVLHIFMNLLTLMLC